jgi:signal peptidase I
MPKRGDIVVFTRPDDPPSLDDPSNSDAHDSDTNLIKRVIGLPGDRLEVKGRSVYINGSVFSEDDNYARYLRGGVQDYPLVTVPEGKVFLMGDNRDYSRDARFWKDPFLPVSRIKGRALIVYWNSRIFNRIFTVIH